jgi:hypothetical protein
MEQPAIIFVHIPKAAGTTLHRIIEQHYPRQTVYSTNPALLNPEAGIDHFKHLPLEQRAQIRVLKGHLPFGLHEYIPGPSTYFTLLREPVDRVVSFYYYIRQNTRHYLHEQVLARDLTLQQYIESCLTTSNDNFQVRLISGVHHEVPYGQCTPAMLETAKHNLQERFSVMGLSEQFDATLLLLQRAFQWRDVFYVRQNVNTDRPMLTHIPPATLDLIKEHNRLDIELYQFVKQRFEDRLRQAGPDFTHELAAFRAANRRRQPWVRLDWRVREQIRRSQDLALLSQSTHHVPLPLLQTYWLLRQVSLRAWLRPNTSK